MQQLLSKSEAEVARLGGEVESHLKLRHVLELKLVSQQVGASGSPESQTLTPGWQDQLSEKGKQVLALQALRGAEPHAVTSCFLRQVAAGRAQERAESAEAKWLLVSPEQFYAILHMCQAELKELKIQIDLWEARCETEPSL